MSDYALLLDLILRLYILFSGYIFGSLCATLDYSSAAEILSLSVLAKRRRVINIKFFGDNNNLFFNYCISLYH